MAILSDDEAQQPQPKNFTASLDPSNPLKFVESAFEFVSKETEFFTKVFLIDPKLRARPKFGPSHGPNSGFGVARPQIGAAINVYTKAIALCSSVAVIGQIMPCVMGGASGQVDQSGNALHNDVGQWLSDMIKILHT